MKITGVIHKEGDFKSIKEFKKKYPGIEITSINEKRVIGFCETCERPICLGEEYDFYEDGVIICTECRK